MRLTDYTDYSLRVLLYLAVRPEGLTTIQDISDSYGISKNHLMKVVQRLAELGWVETVRGRNGGLRLHKQSAALTVGEVVRAAETDFALVSCLPDDSGTHRACAIQSQCRLRDILQSALHPGSHLIHGQDFDIATVASLSQMLQYVVEQGKAVGGFGEIFGMKTEMKDPSVAGCSLQTAAKAFATRWQGKKSGPTWTNRIQE